MDLSTTYLGLKLPHPLMPGASPLVDDIDTVRKLEDAGAAAIIMHSVFEEQIAREQVATFVHTESHGQSFAEALTYFPSPEAFHLGPHEYLEHLRKVKQAVSVPVIGSINGYTTGGWLEYAKLIQDAGADALELNVFSLGSNPQESSAQLELRTVQMVQAVRKAVRIPVAVKLSPYYTSLAHFATKLDEAGADGLVLFNRFYQPDIDVEELQVRRQIHLSSSAELPLRLALSARATCCRSAPSPWTAPGPPPPPSGRSADRARDPRLGRQDLHPVQQVRVRLPSRGDPREGLRPRRASARPRPPSSPPTSRAPSSRGRSTRSRWPPRTAPAATSA